MSDQLAARIRTYWPLLLGHLAAVIIAAVLRLTGVELDSVLVLEALGLILSWGIYELGRFLEHRDNPIAAAAGRWLISMGRDIGAPIYGQPPGETTSEYEYGDDGAVRTIRLVTIYPPKP